MKDFKKGFFFNLYNEPIKLTAPSAEEVLTIENHIEKLNVDSDNFFKSVEEKLSHRKLFESLETQVGLQNALTELDLIDQSEVIVVWDYPAEIARFELDYLLNHWTDIWFPISDEVICLYFPVVDKLIVITHWDNLFY